MFQFCAYPRVTSTCATRYWQEAAPPQPSCTTYSCGPSQASVYPCFGSDLPSIFQQICETNPTAKSNPLLLVSRHSQIHQLYFLLNVTIEGERGEGEREGIMACSCFCFGWFFPLKQQGEVTQISSLCYKILVLVNTSGH